MVAIVGLTFFLSTATSFALPHGHALQLGRELGLGQAVATNPGLGLLNVRASAKAKQDPCVCHISPCPCASYEEGPDPEDEALFYAVPAFTEEDLQAAAGRAYVSAIIEDEDRRIASFAAQAAQDAADAAERERAAHAEAERRRLEIQEAEQTATLAVADRLGNATVDILAQVAERAMEAGRQAQAVEDQQAIADAWRSRAEELRQLADNAGRDAASDEQRTEAMRAAAAEFGENVNGHVAAATAAVAHANEAQDLADELQQAAVIASEEANSAAEANANAMSSTAAVVHSAAMGRVREALRTQDMLSAAKQSPGSFAAGVAHGLQQ